MKPERKIFAQFFSPGTVFAEHTSLPMETDSIEEAVMLSKKVVERYNATPYAFDIVTKLVAEPIDDGEGGKMEVPSKEVERIGRFFLGGNLIRYGEVASLELEGLDGGRTALRYSMRSNGCPICIENNNSFKSTQPFEERDAVVDPDTGKILAHGDTPELIEYRAKTLEEWE